LDEPGGMSQGGRATGRTSNARSTAGRRNLNNGIGQRGHGGRPIGMPVTHCAVRMPAPCCRVPHHRAARAQGERDNLHCRDCRGLTPRSDEVSPVASMNFGGEHGGDRRCRRVSIILFSVLGLSATQALATPTGDACRKEIGHRDPSTLRRAWRCLPIDRSSSRTVPIVTFPYGAALPLHTIEQELASDCQWATPLRACYPGRAR
jgi:hypothetical protein